ncbi:MAG TPA: sn-glycerol-3-phosphate ABC transporter ATP-binding protein UgpC [Anaeromyxobacteraceae bacterium]|nr:sn-glycerol-3-phosphate ABC transporter ATP-binding protein UgpC [Anaeromyxobacteraceae bacterium]
MSAIALSHIVKRYGEGQPAVDDVTLDVADGELVVLVGPSGCGKSTILRMIAGLEDVTSGEVRIGGEIANEQSPRDRRLAMVFQNYALYPHLSVFENIAFPLRIAGKHREEEIHRRIDEVAALLELSELLDRRPAQLSGGQRQRVAMGRAIVREARAFLFDEPLSNLDAKLRAQMRTEIARLQRRLRVTTVYVTHDQVEAMTLGDRVAVLRKGVLQQVDRPRELYERPANMFVAGFIGSPAMNFVPATIEDGSVRLPFATARLPGELLQRLPARRLLIAGIRPEHFEDAALVNPAVRPRGTTFDASVDVAEWVGSEQLAYVPYEAPSEVSTSVRSLARELDSEAFRTQLVVSLDAASSIRSGDRAELWFDARRMHFFDPRSGDNLMPDVVVSA